jgi:sugar/nucleoside kinase (ribokinase family)
VKIVFIGGAHMDHMGKLLSAPVNGASNPGKLTSQPGGAGLNSASVAAMLDVHVSLVGPVGDDVTEKIVRQTLIERNIHDGLVSVRGRQTGSYTSIIGPDGDLVIGLADLTLYEDTTAEWLFENCADELEAADYWFLSANLARSSVGELIERAKAPIAAATVSISKAIRLRGVLEKIDVLFTNRAEAQSLLRSDEEDCEKLAGLAMSRGVKSGVVSNGRKTFAYFHKGKVTAVEVPPVDGIVDVTGAGDALAGTVLAGLGKGMGFDEAVRHGAAAGQATIKVATPVRTDLTWDMLVSGSK